MLSCLLMLTGHAQHTSHVSVCCWNVGCFNAGNTYENIITSPNIRISHVSAAPSGLYRSDHCPLFAPCRLTGTGKTHRWLSSPFPLLRQWKSS